MDEVAPKVEPAAVEWIRTIFLGEKRFLLEHGIDLREIVLRLRSRFWQQDVSVPRNVSRRLRNGPRPGTIRRQEVHERPHPRGSRQNICLRFMASDRQRSRPKVALARPPDASSVPWRIRPELTNSEPRVILTSRDANCGPLRLLSRRIGRLIRGRYRSIDDPEGMTQTRPNWADRSWDVVVHGWRGH
jgi:hypothetical protein